jgi:hypothetical protein
MDRGARDGCADESRYAIMADAIAAGQHISPWLHALAAHQDLVYRAGGLMLINPIYGPGIASLDVHPATMSPPSRGWTATPGCWIRTRSRPAMC